MFTLLTSSMGNTLFCIVYVNNEVYHHVYRIFNHVFYSEYDSLLTLSFVTMIILLLIRML